MTSMMTAAEAAAELGVTAYSVTRLANRGQLVGVRGRTGWLVDPASVTEYRRAHPQRRPSKPPKRAPRLPAGPLVSLIERRGGERALGVETFSADFWALRKARDTGSLTIWQADRLAVRLLGLTPLELWGDDYLSA